MSDLTSAKQGREIARLRQAIRAGAAALNLRNLIGKGLARRDGAWALAT